MVRLALLAAAMFVVGCGDGGGTPDPGDDGGVGDGGVDDGAPGDGALDDALPGDGANPDGGVGVACGTATCSATQECCVSAGGRECVDQGSCQGVALTCDGPEDCSGTQVCCAGGGGGPGGPGAGGTECRNANQCQANVCASGADCSGGKMCCAIQELGVSMCLASCP